MFSEQEIRHKKSQQDSASAMREKTAANPRKVVTRSSMYSPNTLLAEWPPLHPPLGGDMLPNLSAEKSGFEQKQPEQATSEPLQDTPQTDAMAFTEEPPAQARSGAQSVSDSALAASPFDPVVHVAPVAMNRALIKVSGEVNASSKAKAATLLAQPPQMHQPMAMMSLDGDFIKAPQQEMDYSAAAVGKVSAQSAGADQPIDDKDTGRTSPGLVIDRLDEDQIGALGDDARVDLVRAIKRLPETDPSLYPAMEALPKRPLNGHADPMLLEQQAANSQASIDEVVTLGRHDIARDRGEAKGLAPRVKPAVLNATPAAVNLEAGTKQMNRVLDNAKAASLSLQTDSQEADIDAASLSPTDARLLEPTVINHLVQTEQASTLQAARDQAQAQFTQHNAEYTQNLASEEAQSASDISAQETQATLMQQQERTQALDDVQVAKQAWQLEQNKAQLSAQSQTRAALHQGQEEVMAHSSKAQEQAQQVLQAGHDQAIQVRMAAEAKVSAEKSKVSGAEDPDEGVFGWLASKAKAVFSAIKNAISIALEYARQHIQKLLKAANKAALAILEKARQLVVSTIGRVSKTLMAISNLVRVAFPALSAQFSAQIQHRLGLAMKAINTLASDFKTSASARLEALAANLGGLVSRLNVSLQTTVANLSASVQGALVVAADTAKRLGRGLYQSVSGFFAHIPGYHLLSQVIGRDPVSGNSVEANSVNLMRALVGLIPGGEGMFSQLNEAGAVARAGKWVGEQLLALGLTWEYVKSVFAKGWASLTGLDLLHPQQAFEKIKDVFAQPLGRLFSFVGAATTQVKQFVFEGALSLAGSAASSVMGFLNGSGEVLSHIIKDPIGFLANLLSSLKQGFGNFRSNISKHLQNGFSTWLFASLAGGGIQLPAVFDLQGILSITLQVLGVTWEKIRHRVVKRIGEENMQRAEAGADLVKDMLIHGPAAAWQFLSASIGNLKDMVFGAIQNFVISKIVKSAITQLVMLANPVGAVIKAISLIYDVVMFFIERAKQIAELVQAITASVSKIAIGALGAAANFIESAMARTLPITLGFLARLLHLSGISDKIKGVIKKIQAPINKGIDKLVRFVANKAKGLAGSTVGKGDNREKDHNNGFDLFASLRAYNKAVIKGGHKLKFEDQSNLVIHSTPKSLNAFLLEKQEEIYAGKDSDSSYSNKQKALNRIKSEKKHFGQILGKYRGKQKKNYNANMKAEFHVLKDSLKSMANHLSIVGVDIEETSLVTSKVQYTMSGDKALRVWAEPLTRVAGNTHGSSPGSSVPKGWDKIEPAERSKHWVRAHLVNHHLHGPGKEWNLFPAHKTVNSEMEAKIESVAKRYVHGKGQSAYYYDASLTYDSGDFPTKLAVSFGFYDTGTKSRSEEIKLYSKVLIQPSVFYTVNLNTDSAARLQEVAKMNGVKGMGTFFINLVKERQGRGEFDDMNDLEDRVKGSASSHIEKLDDLIEKGFINI